MSTLLGHQSNADDYFFDCTVCIQTMHYDSFSLPFLVNAKNKYPFSRNFCCFSENLCSGPPTRLDRNLSAISELEIWYEAILSACWIMSENPEICFLVAHKEGYDCH